MRTRTTTAIHIAVPPSHWVDRYYHVSDGSDFGGSSGDQAASATGSRTEVIEDQGTVTNGVKPVTHTVSDYIRSDTALKLTNWTWNNGADRAVMSSGYISLWDLGVGYSCPPRIEGGDIQIVFPKTKEELRAEAMHKFYNMNETNNLLNAIEAGQLVSSLYSLYEFIKRYIRLKSNPLSLMAGLKQSSKDLSNQYLAYQFGWAPLIADLKKIQKAMPRLRQNLRKLAKNASAPKTYTAKCVGTFTLNVPSVKQYGYSTSENPNDGSYWHARLLPEIVPVRLVGVRGRHGQVYSNESLQIADYLMTRFIATGPISLAWELVKFSFVVDWFVNLTSLIDHLDNTIAGDGTKIDRCWTSEKYAFLVPCYKHKCGQFVFPCDGQQVALSEVRYYHREALNPDLSITAAGRFGKKQATLSLALFRQMAANLRK